MEEGLCLGSQQRVRYRPIILLHDDEFGVLPLVGSAISSLTLSQVLPNLSTYKLPRLFTGFLQLSQRQQRSSTAPAETEVERKASISTGISHDLEVVADKYMVCVGFSVLKVGQ